MIVEQMLAYDATTGRELLDTLLQRYVPLKLFAHAEELKERHEFLEGRGGVLENIMYIM